MTVQREILVDMPKAKIYEQPKKGVVYIVYRPGRKEAREGARPRCIGIRDPETKRLWPNEIYFQLFGQPQLSEEMPAENTQTTPNANAAPKVKSSECSDAAAEAENLCKRDVFSIGYCAVIERCFNELQLDKLLSETFGRELSNKIKIITAYIIGRGCILSYIDDFTENSLFFNGHEILNSQKISDIFEDISSYEDLDFYRNWIKFIGNDGYICYDVTSVSTYSKMLLESEYGYNRDHDDLPQINIGLFTSEQTRYPVYMFTYNGSVNDKTELIYVIKSGKNLGMSNIKLVLDGGFFDKDRIKMMSKEGIVFTIGVPLYLDISKKIVDEHGKSIYNPENLTYCSSTYGLIVKNYKLFGVTGNIFIGHSTETATMLNKNLNAKILKYKMELDKISKYSTVNKDKKYIKLFDIIKNEDNIRFTYKENKDKINAVRKYFGYFVIFTTDLTASCNDLLRAYREKDTDEKAFYEMKQYMEGRRTRVHKMSTFDAKYFLVFLSLICRLWINNKLDKFKRIKYYTFKRCLLKLENIRVIQQNNTIQILKAITAEQREMLQLCGVEVSSLEEKSRVALESYPTNSSQQRSARILPGN